MPPAPPSAARIASSPSFATASLTCLSITSQWDRGSSATAVSRMSCRNLVIQAQSSPTPVAVSVACSPVLLVRPRPPTWPTPRYSGVSRPADSPMATSALSPRHLDIKLVYAHRSSKYLPSSIPARSSIHLCPSLPPRISSHPALLCPFVLYTCMVNERCWFVVVQIARDEMQFDF